MRATESRGVVRPFSNGAEKGHPMKRTLWLLVGALATVSVLGDAGCTALAENPARARGATRTFALAVTVNGGSPPSPEQWNALRTTFTALLGKRGFTLVENATHAAHVIHVNFVTPPGNPLVGTAVVLSIEQSPSPLSTGYPGVGAYGPRRVTLASFDPVLAADRTIYLAPKIEPEVAPSSLQPDAG